MDRYDARCSGLVKAHITSPWYKKTSISHPLGIFAQAAIVDLNWHTLASAVSLYVCPDAFVQNALLVARQQLGKKLTAPESGWFFFICFFVREPRRWVLWTLEAQHPVHPCGLASGRESPSERPNQAHACMVLSACHTDDEVSLPVAETTGQSWKLLHFFPLAQCRRGSALRQPPIVAAVADDT